MIEKLKQLVLNGGFDEESKRQVADLENRLHKAVMAEKLAEHPVIKDFVEYLTIEIERCTYLLAHDEKLSEAERNKLFAKREIAEQFTKLFVSEKSLVEEEIKTLINVASTNQ